MLSSSEWHLFKTLLKSSGVEIYARVSYRTSISIIHVGNVQLGFLPKKFQVVFTLKFKTQDGCQFGVIVQNPSCICRENLNSDLYLKIRAAFVAKISIRIYSSKYKLHLSRKCQCGFIPENPSCICRENLNSALYYQNPSCAIWKFSTRIFHCPLIRVAFVTKSLLPKSQLCLLKHSQFGFLRPKSELNFWRNSQLGFLRPK